MRMLSLVLASLVLGLSFSVDAQRADGNGSAQAVAIRAGTVIDPEKGSAEKNQVILVQNGTITAVGGSVQIPAGARVIDLSQHTVLPGLFDAHTHLCLDMNIRRDDLAITPGTGPSCSARTRGPVATFTILKFT